MRRDIHEGEDVIKLNIHDSDSVTGDESSRQRPCNANLPSLLSRIIPSARFSCEEKRFIIFHQVVTSLSPAQLEEGRLC